MTARAAYVKVGDLVGHFDYLNLSCEKCGRSGRYAVAKLMADRGPDFSLTTLKERMTKDCPRRGEGCAAAYPDFPKPA
jgi:hypothetical protein